MNRRIRPNIQKLMPSGGHFVGTVRLGSFDIWAGIGGYLNYRGSRNNPHAHSHHEVCLVLNGTGWFDHDNQRYTLESGDLFLAHPGITHEIISHKEKHLEICFISFSIGSNNGTHKHSAVDELVRQFERRRRVLVRNAERLGFYFQALAGLQPYDDAGSHAESRAVISALVAGIMNAATARLVTDVPEKAAVDSRVAMALRYMDDNLTRTLSVPELARQAFTSERSLRRLVKAACGHPVVKEFARRRIAAAAERLTGHPDMPVAEIAFEMGYSDAAQFSREFKAVKGVTPGVYRRSLLKP